MIINGGVRRVVAQSDYADPLAKELLAEAKVKTEIFDPARRRTKPFPMPAPTRSAGRKHFQQLKLHGRKKREFRKNNCPKSLAQAQ
jgi:deoxycytidylate deaminase